MKIVYLSYFGSTLDSGRSITIAIMLRYIVGIQTYKNRNKTSFSNEFIDNLLEIGNR